MSATSVGEALVNGQISLNTREPTQEKSPMSVCSVEKVSPRAPTSSHIKEFIRERSLTNVPNVRRVSAGAQPLLNTRGFTLTKSCKDDLEMICMKVHIHLLSKNSLKTELLLAY